MANFTTAPVVDGFETTLAQAWNGLVGTIFVDAIPNATLTGGKKTYVVVNPGKTTQQVARISGWSTGQLTCDSVAVKKGAGTNYTSTTHAVKSKVIITDVYQSWEDLETAINSKASTDVDVTFQKKVSFSGTDTAGLNVKSLTTTQRDALTPAVGDKIINTTLGVEQTYIGGAWVESGPGATTPNASTTVAGKVEKATAGEVTAGTATGGTGAELFVGPAELKTVTDGLSGFQAPLGENTTAGIMSLGQDGKLYMLRNNIRTMSNGTLTGNSATGSCLFNGGTMIATFGLIGSTLSIFIGTINAGTGAITYGAGTQVTTNIGTSGKFAAIAVNTDRIIVSYDNGTNYGSPFTGNIGARAISISGTTPTIGSEFAVATAQTFYNFDSVCEFSTDRIAILWKDNADSKISILSVSGTTLSQYGSVLTEGNHISKIRYVSSGKLVIGSNLGLRICFDNGTTLTAGTIQTLTGTSPAFSGIECFGSTVAMSYTSSSTTRCIVCTISGNALTGAVNNTLTAVGTVLSVNNMVGIVSGTSVIRHSVGSANILTLRNTINYGVSLGLVQENTIGNVYYTFTVSGNPSSVYKIGNESASIFGYFNGTGNIAELKSIAVDGAVITGLSNIIPGATYFVNETTGALQTGTGLFAFGKGQTATTLKIMIDGYI